MTRSRRSNRPDAQPRPWNLFARAARRLSRATALAELAGAPDSNFEQLEDRQLLFSLVVDPSDPTFVPGPGPNWGSVTTQFAYFIPYLTAIATVQTQTPTTTTDDFNTNTDPGDPGNYPAILLLQSGRRFVTPQPNIGLAFTATSVGIQRDPGQQQGSTNNHLIANISGGQEIDWTVQPSTDTSIWKGMLQFGIDLGGDGTPDIDPANFTVELRYTPVPGGPANVLQSFTGAALAALGTPNAAGGHTFLFPPGAPGSIPDEVVIRANAGLPNTNMAMDNVRVVTEGNKYDPIEGARVFGAQVVLSGPIGATAQFLDLYGNDIQQPANGPLLIGDVSDSQLVRADRNLDGIPDYNDGIGKIILSGMDRLSALTLWGGTITTQGKVATFNLGGGQGATVAGLYNDFERAGFGFNIQNNNGQVSVTGMPPGTGSVIVGSPFVRNNTSENAYNAAGTERPVPVPIQGGFARTDQGVFLQDGTPIHSVYIHGMVFGSSHFGSFVDQIVVGTLMGSMTVNGDLGALVSAGDAGMWVDDPNQSGATQIVVKTNSVVTVGRTLGEFDVGGRSLASLTVVGDLNSPTHQARDILRYQEREFSPNITGQGAQVLATIQDILGENNSFAADVLFGARVGSQQVIFGTNYFRNDTIMGAEWVGSAATSVQISGDLGARDPVNTAEDPSDVYAFPVDGTRDIDVHSTFPADYMRLVDKDGRTLAAVEGGQQGARGIFVIRYHPTAPGVIYLVIQSSANAAGAVSDESYVVTINGMASVTAGAYRVAGQSGRNVGGQTNVIDVLNGSMGSVRVGTGYVNGAGVEVDPGAVINILGGGVSESTARGYMTLRATSFSIAGNLYNITTGTDIDGGGVSSSISVGGNLGDLVTGLSNAIGQSPFNGDLRNVRFTVGGAVGMIDVRGGLGINTTGGASVVPPLDGPGSVVLRTGQNTTLKGDVGLIRIGNHAGGDTLIVQTSNNSIVGGFLVSQDVVFDQNDTNTGIYAGGGLANGEDFELGANSDLRFFDTPNIDLNNVDNLVVTIGRATPTLFTDDAGGQVTMQIIGGGPAAGGDVRVLPVAGSLGVAIGRIRVNLIGGARLLITGLGAVGSSSVVSIGRIQITDADAGSSIGIIGNTQVDVWRIDQVGGTDFGGIGNDTPGGDVVAIDMVALGAYESASGDLGRTQMPAWGPQLIGPFLGVTNQPGGGVGTPIGINAAGMTPFWNGNTYRPVNNSVYAAPQPGSWADDVGAPTSAYLNGLLVRTKSIGTVLVGGAIGDVLATDRTDGNNDTGNIGQVIAHNGGDIVADPNHFRGIVGDIYANRIGSVDVGDGLAPHTQNALSTTGIFANDDIATVKGGRIAGAEIDSNVEAANVVVGNNGGAFPTDGIDSVTLTGGRFNGAFITSMTLDFFWSAFIQPDDAAYAGRINKISGTGTDMLGSTVAADTLGQFTLTNGFFDASRVEIAGNADRIEAKGYRNSSIGGGELEFNVNEIDVGGDLLVLTTTGRAGDLQDLTVRVTGRIGEVSAFNISRTALSAAQGITTLTTLHDLRGSSVSAGLLTTATIGGSIRSSAIAIAGPLATLTVADSVSNTDITVSGPDGSLGIVTVANGFDGTITSAGPINTVEVTHGSMHGSITTLANQHGLPGNVHLLKASGDLDITTDISGTIDELSAGGNIGNRLVNGTILIRGDVHEIDAPSGQIYSDIRIGGSLLGSITIGQVDDRLGRSILSHGDIIAFGRLETITITGDYAGQIISYSGGIGVVTINNGSLLPGGAIKAFDGDLSNVIINNGNLYGDIHADYILFSVRLNGSSDGVFGDIGINPAFNQGAPYDGFRNQLPPGVVPDASFQGPHITAGRNIGRIILTNGSIFEGFIFAGRALGTVDVTGNISNDNVTSGIGTVIAAGSTINLVHTTGSISDAAILVGVRDFGADDRPGGVGNNADTIQSGRLTTVQADGSATNLTVAAGINAGADGVYATSDDFKALGISYVREVTVAGSRTNVRVFADSPTLTASPGIVLGGTNLPLADPDISDGTVPAGSVQIPAGGAVNFTWEGVSGSISFVSDHGQAFWTPSTGQVSLINTSLNSQLVVHAGGATLSDFRIVSNNNASMGLVEVDGNLAGNSKIVIDAYVVKIQTGNVIHGDIRVGANVRNITTGSFLAGNITAPFWARDIIINGTYGSPDTFGEARIDLLAGLTITISGDDAALVNVDRDLSSISVGGTMNRAQLRVGNTLGTVTAAATSQTRISVGDNLGSVAVAGDATATSIQSGGDLGADAAPGGVGPNADTVSAGSIGSVTVGGNFVQSDVVAGFLRGPDGFFGTSDDEAGPGRSNIGSVTIGGSQVGSTLNTQSYRVLATGTIGSVTVAGTAPPPGVNFSVEDVNTLPTSIIVKDIQSASSALIWTTRIFFNQAMDVSTIGPALTIDEVRDGGTTLIPLSQGSDYTIGAFDTATNSVLITYALAVTNRPLPQQPDVPGPGVFRFILDGAVLRAKQEAARLDANRDGAVSDNEVFSQDDFVGDAGDKLVPEIDPTSDPNLTISFYGPDDLDVVMDNNYTPDGFPDPNLPYTVRGAIGDHPDTDVSLFGPASDTDIYKITLKAGQILRLGQMQGAARFAGRELWNAAGVAQGGTTADTMELPVDPLKLIDETQNQDFLIKTTGVYYIVVTNAPDNEIGAGIIPNVSPENKTVGGYNFTVLVFDDGDTGFAAHSDSGDGTNLVSAPPAITFAGTDGVFGTGDDRSTVPIGDFVFTLDPGPDGIRGTADDIVTGTNSSGGIISTRTNGTSLTTTINSSIGLPGHSGVPGDVQADIDVYNLNNGQPIAAGKTITIHVKLADLGANLGSFSQLTQADFTGDVQFGVFDVTDATGIDDGQLLFSPTDFKPVAGTPGTIAQRGGLSYGYDANGDFFITFITPGKLGGAPNEAAKYAIYLQGVFNTDYTLVVNQSDTNQATPVPAAPQNVFIEAGGGVVNWLEAGGISTKLLPFASSVLGFTGTINGQPMDQYILSHLVTTLQTIANTQGLDIHFSTNPADFEFQPFSTVFLSGSSDPKTIFGTDNYGYSQHSDPFNTDLNDQAVIFLPSLADLGFTPSQSDVDTFVQSLAGAVGRRVGELMGLRITADSAFQDNPVDIMSANSVFNPPVSGSTYAFSSDSRALSDPNDSIVNSNFFLGQQNAFALLQKFLV